MKEIEMIKKMIKELNTDITDELLELLYRYISVRISNELNNMTIRVNKKE